MIHRKRSLWNELADEHKVGLLFHEAIYSLAKENHFDRTSYSSRVFISHTLFNPAFKYLDFENLMDRARHILKTTSFLSYEQHQYWQSSDYALKCTDFSQQLKSKVLLALRQFQPIHEKYTTTIKENYEKLSKRVANSNDLIDIVGIYNYPQGLEKIFFNGEELYSFPENLSIPETLTIRERLIFRHAERTGRVQTIDKVNKTKHKALKKTLREVLKLNQRHSNDFFGRCIQDPLFKKILKNINSIKINQ